MTYIVAISAYLVLLTIFGLIVARKKVKTSDDMVTGGHRIPFIILVGTLLATWCGGGGITGSASVVYTGGPWVGLITFAAPPIGIILLYFIAGKVRKSNKVTVPEIMGARYGKAASIIAALCVMLAYVDKHTLASHPFRFVRTAYAGGCGIMQKRGHFSLLSPLTNRAGEGKLRQRYLQFICL